MKAISLFEALQTKVTKKATAPVAPAPAVNTSYLKKFANLSEPLKKEIIKTAEGMGYSSRDIYDIVLTVSKNTEIQKKAEYIKWLKDITST